MSEVWKFPIEIVDEQTVRMPEFSQLLHIAEQCGILCLWARVTPPLPHSSVGRRILVRGTGHEVGNEPYVGTALASDGLVWHVFDGGEEV